MSSPESTITPESTVDEIRAAADVIKASGASAPTVGRDPINRPMIHNWVEAMGDANPIYVDDDAARAAGHDGIVAPPAMAQVWTMRGLHGVRADDDPLGQATALFDAAGYTSVVATNCDTVYHRYTAPGEEMTLSAELVDVVGPKHTALGEGWFFTTRNTWRVKDTDEVVAEMNFRILKFAPGSNKPANPAPDLDPAKLIRPTASRDTAFFWDGVAAHELRIQRLEDGSLRHPPIPASWKPRGDDGEFGATDYQVASGRGTVYSHVVHHAPKVPGRPLPFVVALVELDEGVRLLGELRDVDPADVRIGLPVQVTFLDFPADGDRPAWTLYAFTPSEGGVQ
ncbi:OB-fold domain-containing protein [Gordonia sp. HY002]|uniref:bifunctional MaoC family dehydratase N-terminal/OB-fold nucleic acid binding domain-containing protein n=1 Tax=Gordonia zhenghanii TaxID=2911516 RepID=UPI001EF148EE|nr:bifunctional MaoC family dehydratase N-terminal/OB-fold nucleic acid binding domain-containing protein [Gordonia zhenghanii]MCF8568980.1 OB-fold domain-containing protein [Gordonia zhenghanii]MCF8606951.1 OB-fold domain-containing protein [Gordonia zhenghanii]